MKLNKREYTLLRGAIKMADDWRGALIPPPDMSDANDDAIAQHDAFIAECRRILARFSPNRKRRHRNRWSPGPNAGLKWSPR